MGSEAESKSERAGWPALIDVASRQYGLATRTQLEAAMKRSELERKAAEGVLSRVANGVWMVGATPRSWRQRVMAACLSVGPPVAASHHSAAELWGIKEVARQGVHVTVPRWRSGRVRERGLGVGVVVHHAELRAGSITEQYGLPVTTLARTLVDLAGALSQADDLLARIADGLDRRRLLDLDALRRERQGRRQAKGGPVVDRLLQRWSADDQEKEEKGGRSDSAAEERVYGWLVDGGLPIPTRQHEVLLPGGGLARLDLAYPLHRVGIEFDGFAFHKGREAFDHDRARLAELAALDRLVVPVTFTDRADDVVRRVRGAMQLRGWLPPGGDGPVHLKPQAAEDGLRVTPGPRRAIS